MNYIKSLIKIANALDRKGLYKEADILDRIIVNAQSELIDLEKGVLHKKVNDDGGTEIYLGKEIFRYVPEILDQDKLDELLDEYNELLKEGERDEEDLLDELDIKLEDLMPLPEPGIYDLDSIIDREDF